MSRSTRAALLLGASRRNALSLGPCPSSLRSYARPTADRILNQAGSARRGAGAALPAGFEDVFVAPAVEAQKSAFVGRACRIREPAQVDAILAWVLQDKKVAKAAHPVIHAWRCIDKGVQRQGESCFLMYLQ
jgi:hypothetical protein